MDDFHDAEGEYIITDARQREQPRTLRSRLKSVRETRGKELDVAPAKTGIPSIDEWMDFVSRVLIRTATDFCIDMAFRGIDEELLSDREIDRIRLSEEERHRIAKPIAELAYKNKYTRKHGREIIATAGSIDALLQLGLWYTRMSRIAMKYRRISRGEQAPDARMRTSRPMRQPETAEPTYTQEFTPGVPDERVGPSTSHNGHHEPGWRPPIVGEQVYNPHG